MTQAVRLVSGLNPECRRIDPGKFFEGSRKMTPAGEPDIGGYFFDWKVSRFEQFGCLTHPNIVQKFHCCAIESQAKLFGKGRSAHSGYVCQALQSERSIGLVQHGTDSPTKLRVLQCCEPRYLRFVRLAVPAQQRDQALFEQQLCKGVSAGTGVGKFLQ